MVDEWKLVKSLQQGPLYAAIEDAAVVADYSLESWYYAVDKDGSVYIVDGVRPPRIVAEDVSAFVSMLVQDDRALYPR